MKTFELESQSVGELVLAYVGFFLRLFGMVFHSIAELQTSSLAGSYGVISLRCSDGKACMVHSIWIAELKFGINTIDIGVWRELLVMTTNLI